MSSTPAKRKKNSKTLNPPSNHNHAWTSADRQLLREMVERGSSTKQAAIVLGRTIPSVWSQKNTMVKEGSIRFDKRFQSSRELKSESTPDFIQPKKRKEVKKPLTSPTQTTPTTPAFMESILTTLNQHGLSATLEVQNGKLKSIILD
jgi:hypothetical protein